MITPCDSPAQLSMFALDVKVTLCKGRCNKSSTSSTQSSSFSSGLTGGGSPPWGSYWCYEPCAYGEDPNCPYIWGSPIWQDGTYQQSQQLRERCNDSYRYFVSDQGNIFFLRRHSSELSIQGQGSSSCPTQGEPAGPFIQEAQGQEVVDECERVVVKGTSGPPCETIRDCSYDDPESCDTGCSSQSTFSSDEEVYFGGRNGASWGIQQNFEESSSANAQLGNEVKSAEIYGVVRESAEKMREYLIENKPRKGFAPDPCLPIQCYTYEIDPETGANKTDPETGEFIKKITKHSCWGGSWSGNLLGHDPLGASLEDSTGGFCRTAQIVDLKIGMNRQHFNKKYKSIVGTWYLYTLKDIAANPTPPCGACGVANPNCSEEENEEQTEEQDEPCFDGEIIRNVTFNLTPASEIFNDDYIAETLLDKFTNSSYPTSPPFLSCLMITKIERKD